MTRLRVLAIVLLAAAGAAVLGSALAGGAAPSPYERVQSARKHLATAKTEVAAADTDLTAAEEALKPAPEEPPPPPPTGEQKTWAPASTSQVPLSDVQAAACVTHKPEVHADNTPFNRVVPTDTELATFHNGATSLSPLSKYVTGRPGLSDPSTDDLIQWAACKWGVPAEWLRAWWVDESNWHQLECSGQVACQLSGGPAGAGLSGRGFGDKAGSNFWSTPTASVVGAEGYTSLGISQIKSRPSSDPHPGTKDLRWKSTAFAVDYSAGIARYYYDGLCGWCDSNYQARFVATKTRSEQNGWEVIGSYEGTPSPWYSGVSVERANHTRNVTLVNKPWLSPGF